VQCCNVGQDLCAREARYHGSCRRDYVRQDRRQHHSAAQVAEDEGAKETKPAHAACFEHLCNHVQVNIIECGNVERMSMLHMQYLNYMEEKSPNTFNPHYSTQKIKAKLTGHFGDTLQFWLPRALCKSELVYSSAVDIGDVLGQPNTELLTNWL